MKKYAIFFLLTTTTFLCSSLTFAAKPLNLKEQSGSFLQSFIAGIPLKSELQLKEVSRFMDFNHTTHIRLQQQYAGYPVWGADAVVHVPAGNKNSLKNNITANGTVYQALKQDLDSAPAYLFTDLQAQTALKHAVEFYQTKSSTQTASTQNQSHLIVYINKNNQAQWAFLVSFFIKSSQVMPAKPAFIMDAMTFKIIKEWNDLQTLTNISGGGFGGNLKIGKLIYDGLEGNYSPLHLERDANSKLCYLKNPTIVVKDVRKAEAVVQFPCLTTDNKHNNIYWDGEQDKVNEAYSPSNDAFFAGQTVTALYQQWYEIPVLVKKGKPMQLLMRVHESMNNAYWEGGQMTFGDGGHLYYPFTSVGISAHEISHGFTEQHSHLIYEGQSGALNESFSDMAAQAAEFYATGHTSWQIGSEVIKVKNKSFRYMDDPTRDCGGGKIPGDECSIAHLRNYHEGLDVHYGSGLFNKVFYLMSTAEQWDLHQAFNVMVQANRYYWTSNTTFAEAACGVWKAALDYHYDTHTISTALAQVGLDVSQC